MSYRSFKPIDVLMRAECSVTLNPATHFAPCPQPSTTNLDPGTRVPTARHSAL
jgi:hypothetical protein